MREKERDKYKDRGREKEGREVESPSIDFLKIALIFFTLTYFHDMYA